jgi:hypothetical protein
MEEILFFGCQDNVYTKSPNGYSKTLIYGIFEA